MPIACILINCAALIWGGVVDYKRREIPNLVPILLLATGVSSGAPILYRLMLMLGIGGYLYRKYKKDKGSLPAGDVKLLSALYFSAGWIVTTCTFCCAAVGMKIMEIAKKQPPGGHVPLCSYMAPAYLFVCISFFLCSIAKF